MTAGVQLRSRSRGRRARARWDRLIVAASVLAAAGWGAVLGAWLQGTGSTVVTPFVAVCAVAFLAVVVVHDAAFLAMRLPDERFARVGGRLAVPAIVAIGAAAVAGLASDRVRESVRQPAVAVLVLVAMVAALLAARAALARSGGGLAFAATALCLALPVVLVLGATYPFVLPPDLTVGEAAAAPATLSLLAWIAIPLIPALIGVQVVGWWAFRGRIDRAAPAFY